MLNAWPSSSSLPSPFNRLVIYLLILESEREHEQEVQREREREFF